MDETLLINTSNMENSLLPNLQNNLVALDLMRKSDDDNGVIMDETMLVKCSPEPSVIQSIENQSLLNNTTLENLFPRERRNELWDNSSLDASLKNSRKNSHKFMNKHKMDLTVNLTFNDTDRESSPPEIGNKTNPFRKHIASCKKYSVNLNLNDTTQLSREILSTVSSVENTLQAENKENILKVQRNDKYLSDTNLAMNSVNEENIENSVVFKKAAILASYERRRSKRYSLEFDLDSSCDSLISKKVQKTLNLENGDGQSNIIPDKKVVGLKEKMSSQKDMPKGKENENILITTSRYNTRKKNSSQKSNVENNQINSPTVDDKINDTIINRTNKSQTTNTTANLSTSEVNALLLEMDKTCHKMAKNGKSKSRNCAKPSKSITPEKNSLQVNILSEPVNNNNQLQMGESAIDSNQTLTNEKAQSILQNHFEQPSQHRSVESDFEMTMQADDMEIMSSDSVDFESKINRNSVIRDEQIVLNMEQNTNIVEQDNYEIVLQGKNTSVNNEKIILKQAEDDKSDAVVSHCPEDLANNEVPNNNNKVLKNKRKKSNKLANEGISSEKAHCSMKKTRASQINVTGNVASLRNSLGESSVSQELKKDKNDKHNLKKDSIEYLPTHLMDEIHNDYCDLHDCQLERPELLERNDSLIKSLVTSSPPCLSPQVPRLSCLAEIPNLSKTFDEFESVSTESNSVTNQKEKLSLAQETSRELQDGNEVQLMISAECTNGGKSKRNDSSSRVKTHSCTNQSNNENIQNNPTEIHEFKKDHASMQEEQTRPSIMQMVITDPSVVNSQHSNDSSQIVFDQSAPNVNRDKLLHQDGVPIKSQLERNSNSEKSIQSMNSQSKVSQYRGMKSADNENMGVTSLSENNCTSKDDNVNFAIPSLPLKRVSSQKSNEAINETTPAKRTRSSTRKPSLIDKTINNLSYDTSLDVSSINQSHPHKKLIIYHSTPVHKVPIRQSNRKKMHEEGCVDNEVTSTEQNNSRRSTRSSTQGSSVESIHYKTSAESQPCIDSTKQSLQNNSLPEREESFGVSQGNSHCDIPSIDTYNSLNSDCKLISIEEQSTLLDVTTPSKTVFQKNKTKQDSIFKDVTPKKKKVANPNKLPKLYKPAKWVNKRLYDFVEKSLSKKYKIERRKLSEEFVITLYHTYTFAIRGHMEPALSNLKTKMRELGICTTNLDFFVFVINYMPYDFRKLVLSIGGAYAPVQSKILPFDKL